MIGDWKELQALFISGNDSTGPIQESAGRLEQLTMLYLANLLLDYVLGTLLSSAALTHLKQLLSRRIKYKEESAAPRLEALAPLVAPVLN